ncbi:threonine synthase [Roseospirillum parvum]|uniref:Threonine synthase n=1 Tax=Roseospirillum parvum TaxID=83401 RepID=A0A1G7UTD7_9PROT|nr:threonine synthase [Roseospirillum parvum]SDG50865.1 threonine synthase [Roseospirillum parvum]
MRYLSTRGEAPACGFEDVLLGGLAPDGGLYLPESWPTLGAADLKGLEGKSYPEVATRVLAPFTAPELGEAELADLIAAAYQPFAHPAVAPLSLIGPNLWLMELFHGPTLAFKDYAMQVLGRLFDHVLTKRGRRLTIVGATSGDTGSAAIEACRDKAAIDIFILHPKGRVSEVQRRQMTTVDSPNVHNIAVEGTFDDCQALVKALFADHAFRDEVSLGAVNSINWARIVAQTAYYVWAGVHLGAAQGRQTAFAVPTGNFGNVFAGEVARRMGLPVSQLVVGSNANDILYRFLESGEMAKRQVVPTLSPSMDIQVSSNFERLLFELVERDPARVRALMAGFEQSGRYTVPEDAFARLKTTMDGHRRDDAETSAVIREMVEAGGPLLDPHSAIGVAAARAKRRDPAIPMVALATAHPAKFPDAVTAAAGRTPAAPPRLAALMDRPERLDVLGNDLAALKSHIRAALGAGGTP